MRLIEVKPEETKLLRQVVLALVKVAPGQFERQASGHYVATPKAGIRTSNKLRVWIYRTGSVIVEVTSMGSNREVGFKGRVAKALLPNFYYYWDVNSYDQFVDEHGASVVKMDIVVTAEHGR